MQAPLEVCTHDPRAVEMGVTGVKRRLVSITGNLTVIPRRDIERIAKKESGYESPKQVFLDYAIRIAPGADIEDDKPIVGDEIGLVSIADYESRYTNVPVTRIVVDFVNHGKYIRTRGGRPTESRLSGYMRASFVDEEQSEEWYADHTRDRVLRAEAALGREYIDREEAFAVTNFVDEQVRNEVRRARGKGYED